MYESLKRECRGRPRACPCQSMSRPLGNSFARWRRTRHFKSLTTSVRVPPSPRSMSLSGWGRFPVLDCMVAEVDTREQASRPIAILPSIARGNGRSYGDSSMAPAYTLDTRRLDRMLAFDEASGALTCESGTLLSDIIELFVPRGWFPPVNPGTKFVTLGGMIASDVHGKNHHMAGFFL